MKLSPGQWRAHMLLEEPFDRTNAARAVCNEAQFDKIKTCIQVRDPGGLGVCYSAPHAQWDKNRIKSLLLHRSALAKNLIS